MKTFIVALLCGLSLAGCATDESAREMPMHEDPTMALDPVSGKEVSTGDSWKTRWNGRWYYFESAENMRAFESNPTAYVSGERRRERRERRTITPNEVR